MIRASVRAVLFSLAAILTFSAAGLPLERAEATPSRSGRRRARRPRRPRLTAAQRRQIRRWHQSASRESIRTWKAQDPPPLVLLPVRGRARVAVVPDTGDFVFGPDAILTARDAFVSRDGESHAIHPRLLTLLYRAVRNFDAPYVHIISGYRAGRPSSRHTQGRAVDFVLPGVSDRRLAAFLRPQGYVGVGIYPTSGFVHIDVRARSYFWSDSSGPDEPTRERAILRSAPSRYDALARRRGEEIVPDLSPFHEGEESEEEESDAAAENIPGQEGAAPPP